MGTGRTVLPSAEESGPAGGASRVEVYTCSLCQSESRFPRFNNPTRLLETRTGRCGEFANAFCLLCRALCLDARWVLDWTDHVWVECWVPALGRYVHCDPCEGALSVRLSAIECD
jgi:peptide-N4-(N-acetyl-beta-glucosaminyl)asparagine amidase